MKYFGTDGIRSKYGDVVNVFLAFKLGRALKVLGSDVVVVATDTRESKDELYEQLALGMLSVGIKPINAGVLPTPGLICYSQVNQIVGVMITASHNPYYDNGLKVVKNGVKLSLEEEMAIEAAIENDEPTTMKASNLYEPTDVEAVYLDFLNRHLFNTNIKVAIDCANGATYEVAPRIFKQISDYTFVTAYTPDGKNINDNVGSTHMNHIKSFVKEKGCDVGFAFDGDGDRVLAVEDDEVIDGDQIIFIIANYFKSKGMLNDNTVVLTKMSNLGILNRLTELGIKYSLTDVGDKYVVRELLENKYSIGGENSGHIIMPDILPTGDGILVALILLKIMTETNKTLHQLLEGITMYADKMVNLKVINKEIIKTDVVQNKIKEIENTLGNEGKVIVRASGTENLIRVSVMAKTNDLVEKYVKELVDLIGE